MNWGDFFCCCLRYRPESPDPTAQRVDEHTVLLPPPSQENYNSTSVLDQRLKDRLGAITSLKKGKMVNVKRSTPFNIRNDPSLLSDRDRDNGYYSDRDRDPQDDGDYITNGHNDTPRSISRVSSERSLSSSQISQRERSERRPILNMRLANAQVLGADPTEGEYIERGRSRERGRRGSNIDPNAKHPGQNGLSPPITVGHRIRIEDIGEISQSWRD
ncbi:hypothetical protein BDM02DRAFT_3113831 [Thelephora ganbajun]|uniref:Uncharacterized protein n=1 Tax=Thelephora ganbajun TaxID=370292 RepID=A0ACB6ZJ73_THEGA|nr:hypothetical protein BDM02DRAFT_3113831 [Thelephora ganbajun]